MQGFVPRTDHALHGMGSIARVEELRARDKDSRSLSLSYSLRRVVRKEALGRIIFELEREQDGDKD